MSKLSKCRRKLPLTSDKDVRETGLTPVSTLSKIPPPLNRKLEMVPNIRSPALNRVQLVSSFVNKLFPPISLLPQLSFFAEWLWLVPVYTSRTSHLDYAAEALALGYFGQETANISLEQQSRQAYSQALLHLSRAIQDVKDGLSSDTLCSTMLLSFYEVCVLPSKRWH